MNPKIVRTPLTDAQARIAERLKLAWLRKKNELELTQTTAAAALGISQGSFTQFLNKHIAVNDAFVVNLCRLIQVDPAEIDERYSDLIYASNNQIPIRYEWGSSRPVSKPSAVKSLLTTDSTLFAVRLNKKAPIRGLLLCTERHSASPLGWVLPDGWALRWRTEGDAPRGPAFWDIVGLLAQK